MSHLCIGFPSSAARVRRVASLLGCPYRLATVSTYPGGEMCVRLPPIAKAHVVIVSDISEEPASFFEVMSLAQSVRRLGATRVTLLSPWIAYGRQDRQSSSGGVAIGCMIGEALSHVCDAIITLDVHSEAFLQSFHGKMMNVLPAPYLAFRPCDVIVAADHSAATRAAFAASQLHIPFVVLEKKRTGRTVNTHIPTKVRSQILPDARFVLIDDIGDRGSTLIAAAKALRSIGATHISAVVTHAVDEAFLRRATASYLDSVRAIYDHATGKILPKTLQYLIDYAQDALRY